MANQTINDFPTKPVPDPADYFLISDSATSYQDYKKVPVGNNVIIPASHVKYVAMNGADLPSNGSFNAPYATLSYAYDQIQDATVTNPYMIQVLPGYYAQASDIFVKPYIIVDFSGATLAMTPSTSYTVLANTPTWSAGDGWLIWRNLNNFSGRVDIDLASTYTHDYIKFENIQFATTTSMIEVTARPQNLSPIPKVFYSKILGGGDLIVADASAVIEECRIGGLSFETPGTTQIQKTVSINNCTFNNPTVISNSSSNGANVYVSNSKFYNEYAIGNNANVMNVYQQSCLFFLASPPPVYPIKYECVAPATMNVYFDYFNLPTNSTTGVTYNALIPGITPT